MTDDCAKSIGAWSKEDVTAAFQATRVVTGPLGPVVIGQNLKYGQFLNSDGGSPTIVLNPNVNWSNPDYTPAINTDGTAATGNVATSFSDYLGISGTSINPQQFMGMVLLHELGHNFPGERHPGDTPQSYEDYDRGILRSCRDILGF